MTLNQIKKFRSHAKKLPCFSCILRIPCGNVESQDDVRDPCENFKSWKKKRNNLVEWSSSKYSTWNKVMKIVVQEKRVTKR